MLDGALVNLHTLGLIALFIMGIVSTAGAVHCALWWVWLCVRKEEE